MLQNLLCLWKKKTHVVFFVFHLEQFSFSPYKCPGLCRHIVQFLRYNQLTNITRNFNCVTFVFAEVHLLDRSKLNISSFLKHRSYIYILSLYLFHRSYIHGGMHLLQKTEIVCFWAVLAGPKAYISNASAHYSMYNPLQI